MSAGTPIRLFDLLGVSSAAEAASIWPADLMTFTTSGSVDDREDVAAYLQQALSFRNVQSGADSTVSVGGVAGQYALAAEMLVDPTPPPPLTPLQPPPQLYLNKLRDVGITLLATDAIAPARCFFVRDSRGMQLVIEQLPVRLILPKSAITSSTTDPDGQILDVGSAASFDAATADAFAAVLRETDAAIYCKARLQLTFEGDIFIEPGVAISFGEAKVFELRAAAAYDLSLIPSLRRIERFEWARHDLSSPFNDRGGVGIRSIDFSPLLEGLTEFEVAELVAEDVVVPFLSPLPVPIPSHGLLGIRRLLTDPDDALDVFSLANAPVVIPLYPRKGHSGNGTTVELLIQRLLFRSGKPPEIDFTAEVVWSSARKLPKGVLIGLDDDWTAQAGMVWDPGVFEIFQILNTFVFLAGLKAGISIGRLREGREAKYCWELLADFVILTVPGLPTNKTKWIELRSLDGDSGGGLVLRDTGWQFGKVHLPDMQSPKGMDLVVAGVVHLIVEAMGWVEDTNGASYFFFSGGVSIGGAGGKKSGGGGESTDQTSEAQFGLRFKRLRFRTSKHEGAPLFKVDGIFLDLEFEKVKIHGYGYITETVTSLVKINEWGIGVSIDFTMNPTYKLAASFLKGTVTKLSDGSRFGYFLAALSITPLPCGPYELSNVRMLFAQNLTPALSGGELPLFSWYRKNKSALILPSDRALVVWKPRANALSAGVGCGFSFQSTSGLFHIDLFIFIAHDEEETGVLAVGELFLKDSPKAIAYVAIEYDVEKQKLGVLIGVDISIAEVFPKVQIPSWMSGPRLTGTLYFGNKPWTIRIGDLADQNSWLTFRVGANVLDLSCSILLAFCFQLVDGGSKGIGLLFDFRASGNWGIGPFRAWFSFGFLLAVWKGGSDSINATIWIEAGFSIRLFHSFHFGAEITLRITYLGKKPWFTTMLAEIEIETPRFLPDVTIRFEKTWSSQKPFEQETLKISLDTADALVDGAFLKLAAPPVTKGGVPLSRSENLSFEDLAAADDSMPRPLEETVPIISTLATIALTFTSAVTNDMAAAPSTGDKGLQNVQELQVRHSLKSFAARRRPRFVPNAAFVDLVSPLQTTLDASGNSALALKPELAMRWDLDTRADGLLYPNRLMINGSTPFVFTTNDPKADEEMLRDPASALCCPPSGAGSGFDQGPHVVTFNGFAGTRLPPRRLFSTSNTWWQWLVTPPPLAVPRPIASLPQPIVAHATFSSGNGPSTTNNDDSLPPAAASLHPQGTQIIGTADLEQPAASARISFTIPAPAPASKATLRFEAYHGVDLVGFFAAPLQIAGSFNGNVQAPPGQPISRLVLRCDVPAPRIGVAFFGIGGGENEALGLSTVIVSRIEYVTVDEALAVAGAKARCSNNGGTSGSSGKLAFLPNHLYEFELTSEQRMSSNSQGARSLRKKQTVLFRTKGLPGLNAVANTGDELRPLIESVYPPPRVRLYRREPAALAFGELMSVFMPLAVTSGAAAERAQKVELALNVDRVGSIEGLARVSVASHDWLDEHRPLGPPATRPQIALADVVERRAASLDATQQRFDALLAASPQCTGSSLQSCRVVKHDPPGGEWQSDTHFRASLRIKDGAHVDRSSFVAGDAAAFSYSSAAWSVDAGGALVAGGGLEMATFGEPLWNQLQAHVGIALAGAASAGLAVGINGNDAIVATIAASGGGLVLRLGVRNAIPLEAPLPALAEPVMLVVHAFDDRVRAQVGDVMLEVDRGVLREGRIALVADGAARFTSLGVDALDMFAFDFATSRYVTFEEHIASWDGTLRVLPVAAAGGTPSMTVEAWRLAHAADIASVMITGADPQRRQALFADLTSSQLLPLFETSEQLTLTRITNSGQTVALLLESPEPLAFSRDVTADLTASLNILNTTLTVPVALAVLTNGDETAALLLPSVFPFFAGDNELLLSFARNRWRDEPSATAAVTRGHATLRFTL